MTRAEGATAPETLRQMDRDAIKTLESSGCRRLGRPLTDGVSRPISGESLRFSDRGGNAQAGARAVVGENRESNTL